MQSVTSDEMTAHDRREPASKREMVTRSELIEAQKRMKMPGTMMALAVMAVVSEQETACRPC